MKVLIIQQKMIGDVLTSSILCEVLKKERPDFEIHYLINSHTFPVVQENPYIDEFVYFKPEYRKSKLKFYHFLKEIKKAEYDIVIDAYCKLESKLITYFSKSDLRISYKKSSSRFFYNCLIDFIPEQKKTVGLAIQNRLALLEPILDKVPEPIAPKIYLSEKEKNEAKQFLVQHKIEFDKPLYMIGILGSDPTKTYPFEYMAEFLDELISKKEATLLFNYIPSQKEDVERVFDLCSEKTKSHIRLDVYAPSLRSFLGLLTYCNGMIGNEGGAVNMAKALDIPSFAIFSPWIEKSIWGLYEGNKNVAIHLNDYKPELFKNKTRKEILQKIDKYYDVFKVSFFQKELHKFLNDF